MQEETILRKLVRIFSGKKKLFPNQVVFYHAVFAFTQKNICSEYLCEQLQSSIQGRTVLSAKQKEQLRFVLYSSLDGDSANIGKHINNNPGFPIPQTHKEHYFIDTQKSDIIRRLNIILRYFWHRLSEDEAERPREEERLLAKMKEEFRGGAGISNTLREADSLTSHILARILYEILQNYLHQLADISFPREETEAVGRIDREAQRQEWEIKINGYGSRIIDRFLALKRLADTNIFAAEELGTNYYYGAEYIVVNEGMGNNGVFKVIPDYNLAAKYNKIAAAAIPPDLISSFTLGFIFLNGYIDMPEEERFSLARRYLGYGAEMGYAPSFNSLGNLEKILGDRLLAKAERTEEEEGQMLDHFAQAFSYWQKGCDMDWTYAHNNLAEFMENPAYQSQILPKIRERLKLSQELDAREFWKKAAAQNNFWAMDQLARIEYQRGDYETAKELWERAASYHYPSGYLSLAKYYYDEAGQEPDLEKWITTLSQASLIGSAEASFRLAEYHLQDSPAEARNFLEKAEEQNYEKFNQALYEQITALKRQVWG